MNDDPSFMLETSFQLSKVALKMDIDNEEADNLQDEGCLFDGIHLKCKGFLDSMCLSSHHEKTSLLWR